MQFDVCCETAQVLLGQEGEESILFQRKFTTQNISYEVSEKLSKEKRAVIQTLLKIL